MAFQLSMPRVLHEVCLTLSPWFSCTVLICRQRGCCIFNSPAWCGPACCCSG